MFGIAIFFQACTEPNPDRPRLIILISIDQMRADYLDRYRAEYTGGFKELSSNGVVFSNADLNYASSETGPGHATLGTGSYPRNSGIPGNEWIDPTARKTVYCVEDSSARPVNAEGGSLSPRNLRRTGLGDWIKAADPRSKVVSVSAKDRAAILLAGKNPDKAFWYSSRSGHMVTSSYYMSRLPRWVQKFNASGWIQKNVPGAWTKLLPSSHYEATGPDELIGESDRGGNSSFPHVFTEEEKASQLLTSPYGDELVLDFAFAAVTNEQLGRGISSDLLCISLSCTDYIGHSYGPDSHEMHENLVRLDRSLGRFFDQVRNALGHDRYVIALSADHGVMPLPEFMNITSSLGKRINPRESLQPLFDSLNQVFSRGAREQKVFVDRNGFLDYQTAMKAGLDSNSFEQAIRKGLTRADEIVEVYPRRTLVVKPDENEDYVNKFRRSYYSARGEDVQVQFCEYCLVTSHKVGTSHGSVYSYDTHIPILIMGAGVNAGVYSRRVHSVDVVPTLARLAGIPFPEDIDGVPLKEVLEEPPVN
jgi:predicted AlkP superfamily pyrophosphatase or phosphodiesterase